MNILVTSGATREYIDGVRFITNLSTGTTGATLIDFFSELKWNVRALLGEGAIVPKRVSSFSKFRSFSDLNLLLKKELGLKKTDVVIHLAAVSDYSVSQIEIENQNYENIGEGKIDTSDKLRITLKKNFKLIDCIRDYSENSIKYLVAFKLTNTKDLELRKRAVKSLFSHSRADLIVHNDLSEISASKHHFELLEPSQSLGTCETKDELARVLSELIRSHL